ncbi:MAG TPA: DsbC family protein [Burkholderiaceae bacterium]|nr:DsbC family protein [Burkholderiaceae bacterium]HQR71290.1 DsbC family protein [Burkholderiaceae bacterium]
MNCWLRRLVAPTLVLACLGMGTALAQSKGDAGKGPPAGGSPEAQVAARFAERSGMKPDQVFRGQGGLFEVLVRGELYYVDPTVNFVIMGRMFDARTREDLTQKRLDAALKVDFKSLPFDQAIKTVKGNGSRVMVTFEDPNCPYCKRLWQNLQGLNNVTIYTFLMPILSQDSQEKAKAIWCSKNRATVWDDFMVQGKAPQAAAADCKTPLDQNMAMGREFGINGTPTIIFADGSRGAGAMPVEALEQRLAQAAKK